MDTGWEQIKKQYRWSAGLRSSMLGSVLPLGARHIPALIKMVCF